MAFLSHSRENEALYSLPAAVPTATGTALQTLGYYALPANAFKRSGQAIRIKAYGHTAANGNTKTVSLLIGPAALISAGATAPTQAQINTAAASATALTASATGAANAKDWFLQATVAYQAALVEEAVGEGNFNATALNPAVTDLTQDATTSLGVFLTATDGTSSAGDVTLSGMQIEGLSD